MTQVGCIFRRSLLSSRQVINSGCFGRNPQSVPLAHQITVWRIPSQVDRPKMRGPNRNRLALIGLIVALWMGSTGASAQVVTVPPGLSPGAKYRLVFVTGQYIENNEQKLGTMSRHKIKHQLLQQHRGESGWLESDTRRLSTTWKAIASTSSMSAKTNTSTNTRPQGIPIYNLHGERCRYVQDLEYTEELVDANSEKLSSAINWTQIWHPRRLRQ